MNVLIFVPEHPLYKVAPLTRAGIDGLDTTGHTVTVHYESGLHVDKRRESYDQITQKYQHGRKLTLSGGYDAMLTIEYDNVVPANALQRLAAVDADVAYGLYVSRGNPRWLAFINVFSASGITYSRDEPTAQAAWGKVIETGGIGLGCTLIRRHVLEAIEFRRIAGHPCANDWQFAIDCTKAGFVQKHDCGLHVGHINDHYPPTILWPTPVHPFYRTEIIENRSEDKILSDSTIKEYICLDNIYHEGHQHYYKPGDAITLTGKSAVMLLESGKVRAVEEPVQPDAVEETTIVEAPKPRRKVEN